MAATAPIPASSPRLPRDTLPRVPIREMVALDDLIEDAGTQVRSTIDDGVVDDYAEALAKGARFPRIIIVRTNKGDILAGGFHRVAAYRKLGRTEIEAEVHKGTVRDAVWLAVGANRAQGQRLSKADKRRAIEIAYGKWPQLSQRRIAAQTGCGAFGWRRCCCRSASCSCWCGTPVASCSCPRARATSRGPAPPEPASA